MKNKQDILKLHPMIGRLTPMQWDEIHKAMDAYLNEYKAEQLTLTFVSQKRKLLIAFAEDWNTKNDTDQVEVTEDDIDDYLAINCG
jgi:hypothetical protein